MEEKQIALEYFEKLDYDQAALKYIEAATLFERQVIDCWTKTAICYIRQRDYEKATEILHSIIQLDEDNEEVILTFNLCKILLDIPFMKINFGSNHPLNKFLDRVREYYSINDTGSYTDLCAEFEKENPHIKFENYQIDLMFQIKLNMKSRLKESILENEI